MRTIPRTLSDGPATGISRRCGTASDIDTCNCSLTTENPFGREGLAGWRKWGSKPLWPSRKAGPQSPPARAGCGLKHSTAAWQCPGTAKRSAAHGKWQILTCRQDAAEGNNSNGVIFEGAIYTATMKRHDAAQILPRLASRRAYVAGIMMKGLLLTILCFAGGLASSLAQSKHSPTSHYPSYEGRVMAGYQGWLRAEGDGSGEGWSHYSERAPLAAANLHPDFWPDVSEYEKTYPTSLTNKDGTTVRVFSSVDQSTTDLHFRWMERYGIDGAFVQRFFSGLRSPQRRQKSRVVLENAIKASQKYGRAVSVMYDLSGLKNNGEDCSAIIQDWKELVDELKVTSQPTNNYLYHRGKPLVVIWGLGFPDRGYNIRDIGIDKVISFLKHDPEYGGCSVMLGVPTYFRDLNVDTNPDPYLHELLASADVVMPWTGQTV